MRKKYNFIFIGAAMAGLAVFIGAFGAHGLKPMLSEHELEIFHTGVQYQFYHSLALLCYGIFTNMRSARNNCVGRKAENNSAGSKIESNTENNIQIKNLPQWPGLAFLTGILLFSGSLYLLAITHTPQLGMITPFGGVAFIIGWVGFAKNSAIQPIRVTAQH